MTVRPDRAARVRWPTRDRVVIAYGAWLQGRDVNTRDVLAMVPPDELAAVTTATDEFLAVLVRLRGEYHLRQKESPAGQ